MREILFRGRRVNNGKWVEGYYAKAKDYISEKEFHVIFHVDLTLFPHSEFSSYEEIIPETIGQYIGLRDKNGQRIFEGDIVDCWSEGVNAKGTVQQRKDGLWIIYPAWQKTITWGLCPDEYCNTTVEVVGNIHDNPELMEGEVTWQRESS